MKIETVFNHIRYTLSNDDLKVGDEVFPIASGRKLDNNDWVLHYLEFEKYHFTNSETDFPNNPHIIKSITKENITTNNGYSHPQVYYKIIKKEKQIEKNNGLFKSYEWVEIK